MIETELATLYEARLQGLAPPLPKRAPLQYADYAVWQRQVIQPDSPYFKAVLSWWENLLSSPPSPTRLPFGLLIHRTGRDPSEGVLRWALEEQAAKRLDEVARHVGTTNFVIRLAAFAALIADMTGNSTVAFGTFFDNRNRTDAQTIVGRFVNMVPIVLSYDAAKTFRQWSQIVHERVFETLAHSELPFDKIKEQLRAAGTKPPETGISFMLSRDHSDQHFGNLTISKEPWIAGTMPSECMIYVDGKKPENCQVRFDANHYDRKEMRALLDRYLRLIDTAAREPELPIGKLVALLGAKPLRWTFKKYSVTFYETLIAYYASSPFLKMIWRPVKRLVTSRG